MLAPLFSYCDRIDITTGDISPAIRLHMHLILSAAGNCNYLQVS